MTDAVGQGEVRTRLAWVDGAAFLLNDRPPESGRFMPT
jgi:hypothetical protein